MSRLTSCFTHFSALKKPEVCFRGSRPGWVVEEPKQTSVGCDDEDWLEKQTCRERKTFWLDQSSSVNIFQLASIFLFSSNPCRLCSTSAFSAKGHVRVFADPLFASLKFHQTIKSNPAVHYRLALPAQSHSRSWGRRRRSKWSSILRTRECCD